MDRFHAVNSSKGCVLEVNLEYHKELRESHNEYPLAPMLSNYQLKIAGFYNIPIGTVNKLVPNLLIKKVMCFITKIYNLFKVRLEAKKIHHVLEFSQSQWLKQYVEFDTQKRIGREKNGGKDAKALYKLMNKAVYGKIMENLRNRF